jgi:hypothetical protein
LYGNELFYCFSEYPFRENHIKTKLTHQHAQTATHKTSEIKYGNTYVIIFLFMLNYTNSGISLDQYVWKIKAHIFILKNHISCNMNCMLWNIVMIICVLSLPDQNGYKNSEWWLFWSLHVDPQVKIIRNERATCCSKSTDFFFYKTEYTFKEAVEMTIYS